MTAEIASKSRTLHARFLLLLLFALSGCSALIYEVVWYQMLQLVIGSTSVSLGILLATFMGGLCIGSLWLPGVRLLRRNPLRAYGALELGIAVCALLVQAGFDPARIKDPLFFDDPRAQAYVPLDAALYAAIAAGTVRI